MARFWIVVLSVVAGCGETMREGETIRAGAPGGAAGATATPTPPAAGSGGRSEAYTTAICPGHAPVQVPSGRPACDGEIVCGGPAQCVPSSASGASNAPECSTGRCIPDRVARTGGKLSFMPCTGTLGQGVCIPRCFAIVRNSASTALPRGEGGCGTEEVCAPCISPFDRSETGACADTCEGGAAVLPAPAPAAGGGSPPPTPAAGSGGAAAQACESTVTRAVRVRLPVRWPGGIGILEGAGELTAWGKATYAEDGSATMLEYRPCGVELPVFTATEFAGGEHSALEIPIDAFDGPAVPVAIGIADRQGPLAVIDPGPVALGVVLADPLGAWPAPGAIAAADHDSDGNPGMTAFPNAADGFAPPPTSIALAATVDRVYAASRLRFRAAASVDGACPDTVRGSAEPLGFDFTVIGCHVKDGGECTPDEVEFIETNRPRLELERREGTFEARRIAPAVRCSEIRTMLPSMRAGG